MHPADLSHDSCDSGEEKAGTAEQSAVGHFLKLSRVRVNLIVLLLFNSVSNHLSCRIITEPIIVHLILNET